MAGSKASRRDTPRAAADHLPVNTRRELTVANEAPRHMRGPAPKGSHWKRCRRASRSPRNLRLGGAARFAWSAFARVRGGRISAQDHRLAPATGVQLATMLLWMKRPYLCGSKCRGYSHTCGIETYHSSDQVNTNMSKCKNAAHLSGSKRSGSSHTSGERCSAYVDINTTSPAGRRG